MPSLLPNGKQQYFDGDGNPLAGGKLYTYEAGTNTPKATYTDADGTVSNTNPVILDARGEATIFWQGAYKITLKDSLDNTIYTVDDVDTSIDIANITYGGQTLAQILQSGSLHTVETIDDLRDVDSDLYSYVYVAGYYAANDGGGGVYVYDSGDVTTVDNGGSVIVAADSARWKLQTFGQPWTVRQFGAVCDYVTDDTTKVQAAIDALGAGGGIVILDGWCLIGDLTVNTSCTVRGKNGIPAQSATGVYGPNAVPSGFVLPAANTITMESGSRLEALNIIEQALAPGETYALPLTSGNAASAVSGFAGTAITLPDPCYDAELVGVFVGGFEYLANTVASASSDISVFFDSVFFDCTEGVNLYADSVDRTSTLRDCRGEPFLTYHLADATKDQRTGVAYSVATGRFTLDNCHAREKSGFLADNTFVQHLGCAVKNDNSTANSFYGFKYTSGGYSVSNVGCIALNCGGVNIYSDLPVVGGVETSISITSATLDNTSTASAADGLIYIADGFYSINGCNLGFNGAYGYVKLAANAAYGTMDGCSVYGTQTPVYGDSGAISRLRIGNLSYRDTSNPAVQKRTWTPVLKAGSTTQTATVYGHYMINNQFVTAVFEIQVTNASGSGDLTIEGLPFTSSNDADAMIGVGFVGYYSNTTSLDGAPHLSVDKNSSVIKVWKTAATGSTAVTNSNIGSTTYLSGMVTYRIDN